MSATLASDEIPTSDERQKEMHHDGDKADDWDPVTDKQNDMWATEEAMKARQQLQNDIFAYKVSQKSHQIPPGKFVYKSLKEIYGITDDNEIPLKESTEKGLPGTWSKWHMFMKEKHPNQPPVIDQFGLDLYESSAFDKEIGGNENNFDISRIVEFITFLKGENASRDCVRKAYLFLNAHLKCEFRARLRHVGFKNDYSPSVSVGKIHDVKKVADSISEQRGKAVWNEYMDIQAEIEQDITFPQIHALLDSALAPAPNSETAKMNQLNCIQFATAFTSQLQDTLHGEDQYKQ